MEEKKPLKIKFKTAVILIIIATIILGVCGANVYASTNGYGNVFFLIKYLITGEKPEIIGKNDLLSDRDITISYEPILLTEDIKLQIRNLQIKDNKAKLIMVVNESKENDVTPLKYKVYNESNKLICEQNSSNNNKSLGEYPEELLLSEFKNEDKILNLEIFNSKNEKLTKIAIDLDTREVVIEGEKEAIEKISEIELKKFLGHVTSLEPYKDSEDERILFAGSMFAQKEEFNVNKLDELNKMLEATGYEILSNPLKNAKYFKIVNNGGANYIEVTVGRGGFEPNTVIDIKDISYCGGIYKAKFNYAFIHEPDAFNMSHLEELDIKDATVYFRKNEDTKYSTFKIVKFEENSEIIEKVKENNDQYTIVTQLTPSGFAGSSLHRIDLYSNKDVYLITFDGGGFEENNIKSKELIARNVDSISKSEDGDIYIKGGTRVKDDLGWIHFEDNNIGANTNKKNIVLYNGIEIAVRTGIQDISDMKNTNDNKNRYNTKYYNYENGKYLNESVGVFGDETYEGYSVVSNVKRIAMTKKYNAIPREYITINRLPNELADMSGYSSVNIDEIDLDGDGTKEHIVCYTFNASDNDYDGGEIQASSGIMLFDDDYKKIADLVTLDQGFWGNIKTENNKIFLSLKDIEYIDINEDGVMELIIKVPCYEGTKISILEYKNGVLNGEKSIKASLLP